MIAAAPTLCSEEPVYAAYLTLVERSCTSDGETLRIREDFRLLAATR